MGGLGYLSSTYNRIRLGSNPRRRIMIEDIIKTHRYVLKHKSRYGDDRLYYEDEGNKILYIMGPSQYIRYGYEGPDNETLFAIDFEGGPYIAIGDEILKDKYATSIGITFDNGVPVVSVNFDEKKNFSSENDEIIDENEDT